eukprot:11524168-Ditylum_brightwellii.AAC.1
MISTVQGICSSCKTIAGDIAPCVISALGARYWWGRWWGRCGGGNGAKKGECIGYHWRDTTGPWNREPNL